MVERLECLDEPETCTGLKGRGQTKGTTEITRVKCQRFFLTFEPKYLSLFNSYKILDNTVWKAFEQTTSAIKILEVR